jgi:hypothetical protein
MGLLGPWGLGLGGVGRVSPYELPLAYALGLNMASKCAWPPEYFVYHRPRKRPESKESR